MKGSRILGVAMLLLGLMLLALVAAANIGGTPALDALAMRLGLAFAPLLEGLGVALTLTGGWLVWRARRGQL